MVVISAIMQWLHNAGWTSLSVVAKKRKRQFVKFAMSKECVYLAPWENRTTSIVYFDLFIYLRLWDIESFKMYTFRCLQTEAMTSFWMFYCPFFEVCKYWVRPCLYPAVPDFPLKLLFVGQDCLKIAVLSVKFYCFLRQNLFAFEFFIFSNTFSTHIERKVEIHFEAQHFDGFLGKGFFKLWDHITVT